MKINFRGRMNALTFSCVILLLLTGCLQNKVPHSDAILFDFKGKVKSVRTQEKYNPTEKGDKPFEMDHVLYFNKAGNIDSIVTVGRFPDFLFTSRKIFTSTGNNDVSWQEFDKVDELKRFGRREWINDRLYTEIDNESGSKITQKDTGYLDGKGRLSKLTSTTFDKMGILSQKSNLFLRDEEDGFLRIVHSDITKKKTDTLVVKVLKSDKHGNHTQSEETGRGINIIRERSFEYY